MSQFPFRFGPSTCCCDEEEAECDICSVDSDTITVTISGLTSHTWCDRCEDLNGTYILTRNPVNACVWNYTLNSVYLCNSDFPQSTLEITASVAVGSGTYQWQVNISFTTYLQGNDRTSTADYEWDSGDTVALDCTAEQVLTYESHTPSATHPMCDDWDVLTVTVNAA